MIHKIILRFIKREKKQVRDESSKNYSRIEIDRYNLYEYMFVPIKWFGALLCPNDRSKGARFYVNFQFVFSLTSRPLYSDNINEYITNVLVHTKPSQLLYNVTTHPSRRQDSCIHTYIYFTTRITCWWTYTCHMYSKRYRYS